MGQALYRKYRSRSLSEIIGQEPITTALQQAIDTNRLSHAYLFTGPRGTGKTSIARILAYAMNGLDYSTDPHLDIIEIDAASNRRIDEIRDLRDKVYIAPTSAKYKVYIIDEVHMLTREAFNALLKTLEEPPAHVVFILATTDAHKLPETIISRTQRYNFRPVETSKVTNHLAFIAKKEKIPIDSEALELLAQHGEGSFRDSISMLDQVSNQPNDITADVVRRQLGIPSLEGVQQLLDSLDGGELTAPVRALQTLYDQGYRATAIAQQLSSLVRQNLADNVASELSPQAGLELLKQLLDVPAAHNPERYLELTLMGMVLPTTVDEPRSVAVAVQAPPAKTLAKKASAKKEPEPEPVKPAISEELPAEAPKKSSKSKALDDGSWQQVLAELKKQYNTIYGIVRMARTDFSEPHKVSLNFAFAFHQKRISDPKNRKILADTIANVTGQQVEIVCSLSKQPLPHAPKEVKPAIAKDSLQDISTIFGGGELL